jgi:hypothetical protein
MIEVTLNEVLNSIGAFRSLSEQKIPAKVAFQIARLIRELDKENKTFDESRVKALQEYSERDENGEIKTSPEGNVVLRQDKIEEYNNKIQELLDTQIQVNAEKISLSLLENLELSPVEMLNLEPFISE